MLETSINRDRTIVLSGVAALTGLSWVYLAVLAWDMGGGIAGAMAPAPWTGLDFLLMFAMWAVMMAAMMLPSATPMILLIAAVSRDSRDHGDGIVPAGAFIAGYVVMWTGFSLAATVLQWGLEELALLTPMMVSASPYLGGGILIAAGLYQLTPLKDVCLRRCRTPAGFLFTHWRAGNGGAFSMGMAHGAFCVGCCWALMGLLFVGGVMNLLWVAAIAVFVLIEKAAPAGIAVGRLSGPCLTVAGLGVLIHG